MSARHHLVGLGFTSAWRLLPHLPARASFAAFDGLAALIHRSGGAGVANMRHNYARARPDLDERGLDELVAEGLRSYMRYWCELFRFPGMSDEEVRASVRSVGDGPIRQMLARGESVVCFLGHMGNWDIAGAWGILDLGRVVTVAEHLRPEAAFREFVRVREQRGLEIYPLDDPDVLRDLVADAQGSNPQAPGVPTILPLLADRDITKGGVEVDFLGGRASMAIGPAVLAMRSTGRVVPVSIRYEQVGRSVTPSGYRTVVTFHEPVADPGDGRSRDRIAAMTQGCADALGSAIRSHTSSWHMMQPIFLGEGGPASGADLGLDPAG